MLSIKDAKVALMQLGLTQEEVDKYEVLAEPYINLHRFLMEKLNISSKETEELTQKYSQTYIKEKLEEYGKTNPVDEISDEAYSKITGDSMKFLALENGYDTDESNALSDKMIEITLFMKNIVTKLQNVK